MKVKKYLSDVAQLSGINKLLVLLSAGSILANVFLALTVLTLDKSEKIIITPPTLERSFWVHGEQVDKEYLTQMATWFLSLNLNYNHNSAESQSEVLLRYVHPAKHAALSRVLSEELTKIKRNRQANIFYPQKITVRQQQVAVTGEFQRFVGEKQVEKRNATFLVSFRFDTGRLTVWDLKEVDASAPFSASSSAAN